MEYQSEYNLHAEEVEAIRKQALKLKALIHPAVIDRRFRISYEAAKSESKERRRLLRSSDRKCRMIASTSTLCDDGKSFD